MLRIGISQGRSTAGIRSAVDLLKVNNTTYNFEQTAPVPPKATGPADLSVAVTGGPFVESGSGADVKVVVTNNGAHASGPTTATALTPGYAATSADGTAGGNGSISVAVPYLAPKASATFTLSTEAATSFRFGLAGAIVLPAKDQPDPNIFNNISVVPLITR